MLCLVVNVVIIRQVADRDQPVTAGLVQRHKQTEATDTADAAMLPAADMLTEVERHIAVIGAALGGDSLALGGGDMDCDLIQIGGVGWLQPVFAELEQINQRPVYDQIGIAPDRAGEMGIVP